MPDRSQFASRSITLVLDYSSRRVASSLLYRLERRSRFRTPKDFGKPRSMFGVGKGPLRSGSRKSRYCKLASRLSARDAT